MGKLVINNAYIYYGKRRKKDSDNPYSGLYIENSKKSRDRLNNILLLDIEESFNKENLPDKIRSLVDKVKYKDIVEKINKIRFFTSTQEYELPFIREGIFDYYFYKNGSYIRSLMARPRGRVLNPHMYEALPLMPMGLSSRYFLESRMNHLYEGTLEEYELEEINERGYCPKPNDVILSLLKEDKNKVYDFMVHPSFFGLDEGAQKRLIQNTAKGITVWATFLDQVVNGKEREGLIHHFEALATVKGIPSDKVKNDYYSVLGSLRTLHTRADFYFRTCGIDDYIFFRTVNDLTALTKGRKKLDFHINSHMHKNLNLSGGSSEGWNMASTNYFLNYMYHLLYFILYTIHKEDPAFHLMEKWFTDLQGNANNETTRMFRQDHVKKFSRGRGAYGTIVDNITMHGKVTSTDSYGYNTYVFFIADEGVWQDDWVQGERTAASYGQFIVPVELMSLEEAFDAPTPLKMFQYFLDEADEKVEVSLTSLQKKWEMIAKLSAVLEKESEEAYAKIKEDLPPTYVAIH